MPPRIEIVGYRDPDADTDITVFLDGQPVEAEVTIVDPGSSTCALTEWHERRAAAVDGSSPAAAEEIRRLYELGADTQYVDTNGGTR